MTVTPCRQCRLGLWHCHGTLFTHADGRAECSDPDCPGAAALHVFDVECTEVSGTCCVAAVEERVAVAGGR